ncbi:hypothetical protein LEMLEM_LOCUS9615, partial [Lemmus lemmus]
PPVLWPLTNLFPSSTVFRSIRNLEIGLAFDSLLYTPAQEKCSHFRPESGRSSCLSGHDGQGAVSSLAPAFANVGRNIIFSSPTSQRLRGGSTS